MFSPTVQPKETITPLSIWLKAWRESLRKRKVGREDRYGGRRNRQNEAHTREERRKGDEYGERQAGYS